LARFVVTLLSLSVTAALAACGPADTSRGTPTIGMTSTHTVGSLARRLSRPARPAALPPRPKPAARAGRLVTLGPFSALRTTGSSSVALTFDDGPDPINTPRMLDLLKRYRVKATFCVIGVKVRAHPELVRRIVAEGHSLCNHSWRHLLTLGRQSPQYIRTDLSRTLAAIHAAAPRAKVRYFRAPGGNFTPEMIRIAASLGMTAPLYWQVDPSDWDARKYGRGPAMVSHIIGNVEYFVRPGSIVLSHDIHSDTITAYQTLLPWLERRYRLSPQPH
jgi:peptidoglycan/xylan/chitin deacetylase (PgdA/CDA1 family)